MQKNTIYTSGDWGIDIAVTVTIPWPPPMHPSPTTASQASWPVKHGKPWEIWTSKSGFQWDFDWTTRNGGIELRNHGDFGNINALSYHVLPATVRTMHVLVTSEAPVACPCCVRSSGWWPLGNCRCWWCCGNLHRTYRRKHQSKSFLRKMRWLSLMRDPAL